MSVKAEMTAILEALDEAKAYKSYRVAKEGGKWMAYVTDSDGEETWTKHKTKRAAESWGKGLVSK